MSGTSSNAKYDKRGKSGNSSGGYEWKGFCDIPLSEQDKDKFRGTAFEAIDVLGAIDALVEEGYKVSVTSDASHGAIVASATGQAVECPNRGFALSARAGSVDVAVMLLWYKHDVLAQGGVWENVSQNRFGSELG